MQPDFLPCQTYWFYLQLIWFVYHRLLISVALPFIQRWPHVVGMSRFWNKDVDPTTTIQSTIPSGLPDCDCQNPQLCCKSVTWLSHVKWTQIVLIWNGCTCLFLIYLLIQPRKSINGLKPIYQIPYISSKKSLFAPVEYPQFLEFFVIHEVLCKPVY